MASPTRSIRALVVALAACTALILGGCASEVSGTAVAISGASIAPTTTNAPRTTDSAPTGTVDGGGSVDIDVEIGECVNLGGTVDEADIATANCGSPQSNYVVFAKTPTSAECPDDADQYYYETYFDIEQGALCLDIDWVVGGCMDLAGEFAQRVDCTTPGDDTRRVVTILEGSSSVDDCPDPAQYGFEKESRNFVVCVEKL
ncbi:LppU family putative lipoprotein [Rhodococcus sp. MALMAid1271]|uniref:LppU family putative lipoprotein n=1 Tax=unclassified Rhodococcus (in: high G+C Gram-positive bacteria) TaxID=192944 RepID=UPI0030F6F0AF